jgi:hypothetical protein
LPVAQGFQDAAGFWAEIDDPLASLAVDAQLVLGDQV